MIQYQLKHNSNLATKRPVNLFLFRRWRTKQNVPLAHGKRATIGRMETRASPSPFFIGAKGAKGHKEPYWGEASRLWYAKMGKTLDLVTRPYTYRRGKSRGERKFGKATGAGETPLSSADPSIGGFFNGRHVNVNNSILPPNVRSCEWRESSLSMTGTALGALLFRPIVPCLVVTWLGLVWKIPSALLCEDPYIMKPFRLHCCSTSIEYHNAYNGSSTRALTKCAHERGGSVGRKKRFARLLDRHPRGWLLSALEIHRNPRKPIEM